MKRIAIAVVLAVLLLLAMPVAVSAAGVTVVARTGDGEWTDDTWHVEIYPGETKATALKLYNSYSGSLEVEVSVLPESLDSGNLTFELDKATFTMPGRSYTDVTLSVKANSSTTPSTYTAELTIKSEVPPRPSRPKPPEEEPTPPEEEEPEVIEPEEEEPEVVEPEEEPALPEEEEPEVVEPEEEEPEVVEPGEEEEKEEVVLIKPGINWPAIGGGIAGGLAAGGIGYWLWLWWKRRRRIRS